MIVADVATFLYAHLGLKSQFTWEEAGIHGGFFIAALLLIDPASGKEVLHEVISRVPFTSANAARKSGSVQPPDQGAA